MATGMGLFYQPSLVLVEDPWAFFPKSTTHASLFSIRTTTIGSLTGANLPSSSVFFAAGVTALGTVPVKGPAQLVQVENPEWIRQPDRNQALFQLRPQQGIVNANIGYIPQPPGPDVQPKGSFLFVPSIGATTAPSFSAPVGGVLASSSVLLASLSLVAPQVGFIPQPGSPNLLSPFNAGQFVAAPGSTDFPSVLPTLITGSFSSTSVFYASLVGSGALSGIFPSQSVFSASLESISQGSSSGLWASSSVIYGGVVGIGALSGVTISNSLVTMTGLTGQFVPLVPMTAVTDVRLNIGYQPWKLHPGDVIG